MEKKEISMIVERAKNEFGTSKLALLIGIHSNHVNSVIRGNQALPLPSALRLAELLEADPLTIICANAALMEKNQDKKKYLESHILPLEISRIISAYGNKINSVDHTNKFNWMSTDFFDRRRKEVLQGANGMEERRKAEPRRSRFFSPPWFLKKS